MIKITECPRDAIQGIKSFIPTEKKIEFYQYLLTMGFDTLDVGSFVSPHAVPQMKDTAEVIDALNLTKTKTKLLVIVGNSFGATQAATFKKIDYIGYPFSISETFMKKNINSNISKGLRNIVKMLSIAERAGKELVVYISMAFGNPYKDDWSVELLGEYVEILSRIGVKHIQLSDTTAESQAEDIKMAFTTFISKYKKIDFGFHLHVNTEEEMKNEKIDNAIQGGCDKFDVAIGGKGGCPLSGYEMVANLKTCDLTDFLDNKHIKHNIKKLDEVEKVSKTFYI